MCPLVSLNVMGIAPRSNNFSATCNAIFPDPVIKHLFPSIVSPFPSNTLLAKCTTPLAVAWGKGYTPPHSNPFPFWA
jgi:hypothetical protein